MRCFPVFVFVVVSLTALAGILMIQSVGSYVVDCHTIHSCPSESGEYECGDLGYCQQCPDNKYCRYGQPYNYEAPDLYILGKSFRIA